MIRDRMRYKRAAPKDTTIRPGRTRHTLHYTRTQTYLNDARVGFEDAFPEHVDVVHHVLVHPGSRPADTLGLRQHVHRRLQCSEQHNPAKTNYTQPPTTPIRKEEKARHTHKQRAYAGGGKGGGVGVSNIGMGQPQPVESSQHALERHDDTTHQPMHRSDYGTAAVHIHVDPKQQRFHLPPVT